MSKKTDYYLRIFEFTIKNEIGKNLEHFDMSFFMQNSTKDYHIYQWNKTGSYDNTNNK